MNRPAPQRNARRQPGVFVKAVKPTTQNNADQRIAQLPKRWCVLTKKTSGLEAEYGRYVTVSEASAVAGHLCEVGAIARVVKAGAR